jgi:hypothetical protein
VAYVDVKNQFMAILNRRDITPSLVNTFMSFGIQRIHRELRVPPMEKLVTLSTDGSSLLNVPSDYIEVISINTNDPVHHDKLIKTDLQTILTQALISGVPEFYHRQGTYIHIGPVPPADTDVFLNYYSDSTSLVADGDTNWMTEKAPVLLIYAALGYAADYFLDDRKGLFEATYLQTKDGVQEQANQDELTNASIAPALIFE